MRGCFWKRAEHPLNPRTGLKGFTCSEPKPWCPVSAGKAPCSPVLFTARYGKLVTVPCTAVRLFPSQTKAAPQPSSLCLPSRKHYHCFDFHPWQKKMTAASTGLKDVTSPNLQVSPSKNSSVRHHLSLINKALNSLYFKIFCTYD